MRRITRTSSTTKGRFQLWTEKDGDEQARLLTAGDYDAVPHNTAHTFQILDLDTKMAGVIQPGGFEYVILFLKVLLSKNSHTDSGFKQRRLLRPRYCQLLLSNILPILRLTADSNSSPPTSVTSSLQAFDVYAQLYYNPRRDLVNGSTPSNSIWHIVLTHSLLMPIP
jgi:hypothetical protein